MSLVSSGSVSIVPIVAPLSHGTPLVSQPVKVTWRVPVVGPVSIPTPVLAEHFTVPPRLGVSSAASLVLDFSPSLVAFSNLPFLGFADLVLHVLVVYSPFFWATHVASDANSNLPFLGFADFVPQVEVVYSPFFWATQTLYVPAEALEAAIALSANAANAATTQIPMILVRFILFHCSFSL